MTETTAIDYKEFASSYIEAMKEVDLQKMKDMAEGLKTPTEKSEALSTLLEVIEEESDEFKEDNLALINSLKEQREQQLAQESSMTAATQVKLEGTLTDSSDSATEDTTSEAEVATEAEASEPATQE